MSADARQDEGGLIELIRILQFGDSTFPVGAFSFSCGLETAIQTGVVRCAETLREFTMTAVEQAARGDAIALVCAHAAAASGDIDELCVVDEAVFARKISEEARTMTTRMGKKFTELSVTLCEAEILQKWRERVDAGETPGCHPVALGVVFAVQNLSARSAFVVHQYGVASTILSAALRLLKVSHMDTQKILYEVNRASEASFAGIAHARLSDMAGFSPVLDILAAVHTKAHVRLFMN
jgi:urease accessory protein